jgi:hypothetical protein
MAVEVLRIYMVASAVYARVWRVVWEEITQRVEVVACHPRRFAVSIQAMDCHNAWARLAVQRWGKRDTSALIYLLVCDTTPA